MKLRAGLRRTGHIRDTVRGSCHDNHILPFLWSSALDTPGFSVLGSCHGNNILASWMQFRAVLQIIQPKAPKHRSWLDNLISVCPVPCWGSVFHPEVAAAAGGHCTGYSGQPQSGHSDNLDMGSHFQLRSTLRGNGGNLEGKMLNDIFISLVRYFPLHFYISFHLFLLNSKFSPVMLFSDLK